MSTFGKWTEADVARFNAGRHRALDAMRSDAPRGVEHESDLHDQIIAECKKRGWIYFHGSMAHRTKRTTGEPDFIVLGFVEENWLGEMPKRRVPKVWFVECKTKTGKLSSEQLGLKMWAEKLGHTIHTCRSLEEFLKLIAVNPNP